MRFTSYMHIFFVVGDRQPLRFITFKIDHTCFGTSWHCCDWTSWQTFLVTVSHFCSGTVT